MASQRFEARSLWHSSYSPVRARTVCRTLPIPIRYIFLSFTLLHCILPRAGSVLGGFCRTIKTLKHAVAL